MKNISQIFALQIAIFLMTVCGVANSQPSNQILASTEVHTNKIAIHSIADFRRSLRLGMDTNQIYALFGAPGLTDKRPHGEIHWMYRLPPFPADDAMKGTRVVGLSLEITNGFLMYWGCIYVAEDSFADSPKHSIEPNNEPKRDDSTSLKLFVVSSNTFKVGQLIKNEKLSKLAENPAIPSLTISHLKDATWSTRNNHKWRVDFFLDPNDRAKLKSLTETNVSKTMLVVAGRQLVFAGKITATLSNGSFIEGFEQTELEAIKSDLSNLVSR